MCEKTTDYFEYKLSDDFSGSDYIDAERNVHKRFQLFIS